MGSNPLAGIEVFGIVTAAPLRDRYTDLCSNPLAGIEVFGIIEEIITQITPRL